MYIHSYVKLCVRMYSNYIRIVLYSGVQHLLAKVLLLLVLSISIPCTVRYYCSMTISLQYEQVPLEYLFCTIIFIILLVLIW